MSLQQAAQRDDTKRMQKSIDGLVAALASSKNVAKHSAAAVKAFVDFSDERQVVTAAYGAAQEGALKALRLLEEHPVRSQLSLAAQLRSGSSRNCEPMCTSRRTMEGALSTLQRRLATSTPPKSSFSCAPT